VGGGLDLSGLQSIPAGFNPTVGGWLDLRGNLKSESRPIPDDYVFSWGNGKYIMRDSVLTEVLHKKGNIYKVKIVGQREESFLVIDGKFSAHGETLKKAKSDLEFKIIAEKLKNEPITKETKITIQYYHTVTGACETGIKNWMDKNGLSDKEEITAAELLPYLEKSNAYGLDKIKSLITF